MLIFSKYFFMKYFCSAIWNPNSTPVLFGIFSKFIALFSRAIWDEELYNMWCRVVLIKLFKYFHYELWIILLIVRHILYFVVSQASSTRYSTISWPMPACAASLAEYKVKYISHKWRIGEISVVKECKNFVLTMHAWISNICLLLLFTQVLVNIV